MRQKLKKWLTPGIGVKRWLLLSVAGLICFTGGVLLLADVPSELIAELRSRVSLRLTAGWAAIAVGLLGIVVAWYRWSSTIYQAANPGRRKLVDVLYERSQLGQGLKIVTIGGGTGLGSLLRGLKPFSSNLVAVVTVSDDGGSSGRLSKELGVLPPGDIRNCLVALADDESLLSELFDYRFQDGRGLEGHSFGNLFLAALTEVVGDFEEAIKMSSQILASRGRVLPATLSSVTLCARYHDGSVVCGESAIPRQGGRIEEVYFEPTGCSSPPEVLDAIRQADAIVLGPGSLFTSVIPNLLVEGVPEALAQTKAPKIYVCNVMSQPGETDGLGAADHIEALHAHAGRMLIDYALINIQKPKDAALARYQAEGARPVDPQLRAFDRLTTEPIGANLLNESDVVRHDPERLATAIIDLVARHQLRAGSAEKRHLRAVK